MGDRLQIVPMRFKAVKAFIRDLHRHHKPPVGMIAAVGCALGGKVVGVAVVGRPVSRHMDDGDTLEITRVCTDGTRNAASFLLGADRRLVFALGYARAITYTLPSEGGSSLKAAGYKLIGEPGGGRWSRANRKRLDDHPTERKWLWESAHD